MTEKTLLRPEGLVRSAAFSHVAVVSPGATTIYIGGQNAVDRDGRLVGEDDPAAQTQRVMTNLHIALAAAGASVHDLVLMTILVADGVDLTEAYPVAAASLEGAAPPVVVARRRAGGSRGPRRSQRRRRGDAVSAGPRRQPRHWQGVIAALADALAEG
jgi:enamine deaminase RidA (YjgF/YER057c/UK114 family)